MATAATRAHAGERISAGSPAPPKSLLRSDAHGAHRVLCGRSDFGGAGDPELEFRLSPGVGLPSLEQAVGNDAEAGQSSLFSLRNSRMTVRMRTDCSSL